MRRRIPIYQLERLVSKGLGVSQIADELGFSKGSISKALKRLNVAVTKDVALRSASDVVDQKLDAMGQLTHVNKLINNELDHIEESIQGASEKQRKDLRNQKLRHVAEVRKQLGLFLNIAQTLYNAEEVAKFQGVVMEEIGHAAPEVRDRILQRLQRRRAIGSTLSFP